MYLANGILFVVFIALYILNISLQVRKTRIRMVSVRNGDIQDKHMDELITKAESSGKNRFIFYRPIINSVVYSCIFMVLFYFIQVFAMKKEISLPGLFFIFLWMLVSFSVWQIIVARKIWNLCQR